MTSINDGSATDGLTFRERVQLCLSALDISPTEASRRMDKRDFVGQLLRGEKSTVTDANLKKLASVLKTKPRYLLFGEVPSPDIPARHTSRLGGQLGFPRLAAGSVIKAQSPSRSLFYPITDATPGTAPPSDFRDDDFGPDGPLSSLFWSHRRKGLEFVDRLAREKRGLDYLPHNRPLRTPMPLFDLQHGSVGDLLDRRTVKWTARPNDLIGCDNAYAVMLCRDLGTIWKRGTRLVLTPGREIRADDLLLAIYEPGATGNHLVELKLFGSMMSRSGLSLSDPPGVNNPVMNHGRTPHLLHLVHSISFVCPK